MKKAILAILITVTGLIIPVPVKAEPTMQCLGVFHCTAYCTEKRAHICGNGTGITASGEPVKAGVSVAISSKMLPDLPYGSVIYIQDVGVRVVEDTGGGVSKNQIDVAVDTHDHAEHWELVGDHMVYLLEVEYE